jgi:TPR repeat protein
MKTSLIAALLLLVRVASADNSGIGAFSISGGGGNYHQSGVSSIPNKAPVNAVTINGEIRSVKNNLVYVDTDQYVGGSWSVVCVVITNYPSTKDLVTGHNLYVDALRTGNVRDEDGVRLEIFDFFNLQGYREDLAAKAQIVARQQVEKIRIQNQAAKEHAAEIALKSNQDAAAKGDVYGLLRMGERFRDGDGVEKDLVKARDYLQKAVDAGSITAKEELSKLETK